MIFNFKPKLAELHQDNLQDRLGRKARILATNIADRDGHTIAVAVMRDNGNEHIYKINKKGMINKYKISDMDIVINVKYYNVFINKLGKMELPDVAYETIEQAIEASERFSEYSGSKYYKTIAV
jgi:hypothetical protein